MRPLVFVMCIALCLGCLGGLGGAQTVVKEEEENPPWSEMGTPLFDVEWPPKPPKKNEELKWVEDIWSALGMNNWSKKTKTAAGSAACWSRLSPLRRRP